MNKSKRQLLDRLVRNRFKSNTDLGRILDVHRDNVAAAQLLQRKKRPHYLRGVHNGNYFRVRVDAPPPPPVLPNIPKLPQHLSAQPPVAFTNLPPPAAAAAASASTATSKATADASSVGGGASSSASASSGATAKRSGFAFAYNAEVLRDFRRRLREWWKENWSVIVLNVGSICTLVAFTRSDILELRSLSVFGSTCSMVYQASGVPIRWPPVLWSMMFAGVNSFKIYDILQERNSHVRLTGDQERMYVQHFLPHGVTPKQFEIVLHQAKVKKYPKGTVILKQGDKLEKVQLVVRGATRANILGRRVSAASMPASPTPEDDDDSESVPADAANSHAARASAWIGEMTFLEKYWMQEQRHLQPAKVREKAIVTTLPAEAPASQQKDEKDNSARPDLACELLVPTVEGGSPVPEVTDSGTQKEGEKAAEVVLANKRRNVRPIDASGHAIPEAKTDYSMYTIVATEDCTVLEWSHDDMQALMERSTDLRAALTRALSSAVVGKVINFTISKSQAHRSWSQWLDDWKHSDGATIQVQDDDDDAAAADAARQSTKIGDTPAAEALPTHPIKKYS